MPQPESVQRFLAEVANPSKATRDDIAATLRAALASISDAGEQVATELRLLYDAEMDAPAEAAKHVEEAAQKLKAMRRELTEVTDRLRVIARAQREYDAALAQFTGKL